MSEKMKMRLESRALPDGKGGLFLDGELIQTFDSEAESDEVGIAAARMMAAAGLIKIGQGVLRDEKPYDIFADMKEGDGV